MQIGTLRSRMIDRGGEFGFHETDVTCEGTDFEKSGDKKAFLFSQVSRAVTEQIFVTGLPAEYWSFEFTPTIARGLGYSNPTLRFDGSQL